MHRNDLGRHADYRSGLEDVISAEQPWVAATPTDSNGAALAKRADCFRS
jgi:hypothetical protein